MLHHTINTGHTFDCSGKDYDPEILKKVKKETDKALRGDGWASLPSPFERYQIRITKSKGVALFDFYRGGRQIILCTNIIAWTPEGLDEGWPAFSQTFIDVQKKIFQFALLQFPSKPQKLPFLSSLIFPSVESESGWLSDCEQCFAKVIMRDI